MLPRGASPYKNPCSMATITAKDVNKLRQMTGAGMMDCKKAFTEANGDFDAAVDFLRKRGQKISAKRADRETSEGRVFLQTFNDDAEAILFSLSCETDFVAKNEDFVALGNQILELAVAQQPADAAALNALEIDGQTVATRLTELVGKIGEKIEVNNYNHLKGEKIVAYVHAGDKIGVLVNLAGVGGDFATAGKDVGMQIAAMSPIGLDESSVDEATVNREKEIALDKARQDGKPENILNKIAEGAVKKFLKENTLLTQPFVKNPKQTVAQYVDSVNKGMAVKEFV